MEEAACCDPPCKSSSRIAQDRCDASIADADPTEGHQVLVRESSGKLLVLSVRPDDTVQTIKLEIARRTGLPCDQQTLSFAGRVLQESRSLDSYEVRPLSELRLYSRGTRLCGGGGCHATCYQEADEWSNGSNSSAQDGDSSDEDEESEFAEDEERRRQEETHGLQATNSSYIPGWLWPPQHSETRAMASQRTATAPVSTAAVPEYAVLRDGEAFAQELFVILRAERMEANRASSPGMMLMFSDDGYYDDSANALAALFVMAALEDMHPGMQGMAPRAVGGAPHHLEGRRPSVHILLRPHASDEVGLQLRGIPGLDVDNMGYEELIQLTEVIGSVPRPLPTAAELARLPTYRYAGGQNDTRCAVCQEAFGLAEELRKLPCEHSYHRQCIDTWMMSGMPNSRTCPVCKAVAL